MRPLVFEKNQNRQSLWVQYKPDSTSPSSCPRADHAESRATCTGSCDPPSSSGRLHPGLASPGDECSPRHSGSRAIPWWRPTTSFSAEGYVSARGRSGTRCRRLPVSSRGGGERLAWRNLPGDRRLNAAWRAPSMLIPTGHRPGSASISAVGLPDWASFPVRGVAPPGSARAPHHLETASGLRRAAGASRAARGDRRPCLVRARGRLRAGRHRGDLRRAAGVRSARAHPRHAGPTMVAVEDPGYPPLHTAFAAAGAKIVPVRVDAEGLVVQSLPRDARVICVTPSHQFPLGSAMSARRARGAARFRAGARRRRRRG